MATIFDAALNYLSYCSRTEKEVRDYLLKKNYRKDKIPETINKLKEYKYIDDKQYTLMAIEMNASGKRYGKERLKRSLKSKGISDSNLALIEEGISFEEEEEYCQFHFKKALERSQGVPYKKRVPRIISYLYRRGFNSNHYQSLLDEIPKEEEIDRDDFEKHLSHYKKLYSKKGYEGYELKNRIIKGMLSRGYKYDDIKDALDEEDPEDY